MGIKFKLQTMEWLEILKITVFKWVNKWVKIMEIIEEDMEEVEIRHNGIY